MEEPAGAFADNAGTTPGAIARDVAEDVDDVAGPGPLVGEVADHLVGVVRGPVLQTGLGQSGRKVDALIVDLGGCGEHAHRTDDGEADGDQRYHDGQAGRYPRQVERQPRPAGHHQVTEHPLGEVDRSGRAAQGGGHDEAEDVEDAGHQGVEDVLAAGRPVGLRCKRVGQQADGEEDGGDADGDEDQGHHQTPPPAQLHEPGGDHPTGRDPRAPSVGSVTQGIGAGTGASTSEVAVIPTPPIDW